MILFQKKNENNNYLIVITIVKFINKEMYTIRMKTLTGIITSLGILLGTTKAQTITGRVTNNIGQGLNGKQVEAHLTIDGHYAKGNNLTNSLGYFTINNITDIEEEQTTTESITYTTENNNPTIEITTPGIGNIEIKMFDITGQEIYKITKETYGKEKFPLPTKNLANTIYFISTKINGKTDTQKFIKTDKKIFFGKKDIKPKNNTIKKTQTTTLDSIIVSGEAIQKKTFYYGTTIGTNHNVGDLTVDSLYININGQVYKLFDWTQTNRGIEGATITIGEKTTTTGTNGTYSITIPSGIKEVTITHPNTWTRKTKIIANQNTTIDFDVMDKTRIPENVLAFYDSCSGRIDFFQNENILKRAINKNLLYYIVANINIPQEKSFRDWHILKIDSIIKPALITPMYPEGFLENINLQVGLNPPPEHTDSTYIIKMTEDPPGPGGTGFAYTTIYFNLDSSNTQYKFGETKSVVSRYWKNMPAFELNMDRLVVHEIISGIGGIIGRFNSIPSVLNRGPPYDYRNMTETDKYWFLFTFNRMPGNRSPDTDYYIYNADNATWIKPEEINNYINK